MPVHDSYPPALNIRSDSNPDSNPTNGLNIRQHLKSAADLAFYVFPGSFITSEELDWLG
jgi:hypothetical protein